MLINGFPEYPQMQIFRVNSNALAKYRKAFALGKNDPVDARLILPFLHAAAISRAPLLNQLLDLVG
jgi:hypothetical protein